MNADLETPQTPHTIKVSTELLREKIRNFSQRHRDVQRAKTNDALRFGLGEINKQIEDMDNITEQDVHGLITRIKRRKHASIEEMYRLNHAFLQSIDNIKLFTKTPGALQIIVKELTGIDSERQISAVECLCNLSLGEAPVCDKIVNMVGSYLITYLDSMDEGLKRTSLWTIANTIAASQKVAQTFVKMEIVQKLWKLYVDDSGDVDSTADFREDAAICLQLLASCNTTPIRPEDLLFIKQNMSKKKRNSVAGEYHLQVLFDSEIVNGTLELNLDEINYLIDYILGNLCTTEDFKTVSNRQKILYSVRLLANMLVCQPNVHCVLAQQIKNVWNTNIENILNRLFEFGEKWLTLETLYLLRHLLVRQEEVGQSWPCQLENLRILKFDDYEKLLQIY